ncbi:MAG: hypothetical protein WCO57_06925 [Verrucomicrobiota bacterium]
MKILQVIGVVICVLLMVIAAELRGLKGPTYGEYREALKSDNQQTEQPALKKFYERLPMVEVSSIQGSVEATVKNKVQIDGPVTVDTDFKSPLRVEVSR